MASCSMASSVAARLGLTPVLPNRNFSPRSTRLVVRAAEDAAAAPAAAAPAGEAPAAAAKPPPVGPKRGSKVTFFLKSVVL